MTANGTRTHDGGRVRYIFAYGSLQPNGRFWSQLANDDGILSVERAIIPGRVFIPSFLRGCSGAFPALARRSSRNLNNEFVEGTLIELRSDAVDDALAICDRIEGYFIGNPAKSLYVRSTVVAQPVDLRKSAVEAFVYYFNADELREDGDHIETIKRDVYYGHKIRMNAVVRRFKVRNFCTTCDTLTERACVDCGEPLCDACAQSRRTSERICNFCADECADK